MELKADLLVADRFRLVRPLGEGGMGAVWLADHARLKIPCAIKFMRPEVAVQPAYRVRFDREAVAAAQLRSPHVVQILDHGVWEEMPYIAMEYLEGEDLAVRLARVQRLAPDETVRIVAQVARALTKAHDAGLVHRDLKPANIFVVRDDDRELVKVLDFGIAKVSASATSEQTKTGAIVGTPMYMSPEQAQGTRTVDHRTDLWALGVVVFRCLTGRLPFLSDAFGDLVLKIVVDPLPVPSEVAAVPPAFDAWWARAAARDPAARFQTAKELADALAAAVGVRVPGDGAGAGGTASAVAGATPFVARTEGTSLPDGTMEASLMEASSMTPGAPVRERWRALALASVAAIGVLGAVAYLVMGVLAEPATPASAAAPAPEPPRVASAPLPPASPPAPDVLPAVLPSSAPPAGVASASTASARNTAPPASAPSRSAGAKPGGARQAPSAERRDIGF